MYLSFAWLVVSLICSERRRHQQLYMVRNVALYVLHETLHTMDQEVAGCSTDVQGKDSPFRNTGAY